jgi:TetR/AcrR family transcriptional regulator
MSMKTKSKTTKEKILEAALHEFSMHGVAGARVDEIARSAGVNKAMIYYHFKSKEALFNELFQSEMELLKQETASVLKKHESTSSMEMTQAAKEILAYVKSKRTLLKVLISETTRQDSELPYLFQLLDVTTAIGIETAQKNRLKLPEEEEPVFHEFFSGLLPLIYYTLFRHDLKKYYGWKEKTLDDRFIAYWLRHHGGY